MSPAGEFNENDLISNIDNRLVVAKVLKRLTPTYEFVLRARFGIGFERDYTLEEVGRMMGITRERVRQREAKALRQLRHPDCLRILKEIAQ